VKQSVNYCTPISKHNLQGKRKGKYIIALICLNIAGCGMWFRNIYRLLEFGIDHAINTGINHKTKIIKWRNDHVKTGRPEGAELRDRAERSSKEGN
jgi:hypothetical protein